jgi:hypothetical protein
MKLGIFIHNDWLRIGALEAFRGRLFDKFGAQLLERQQTCSNTATQLDAPLNRLRGIERAKLIHEVIELGCRKIIDPGRGLAPAAGWEASAELGRAHLVA